MLLEGRTSTERGRVSKNIWQRSRFTLIIGRQPPAYNGELDLKRIKTPKRSKQL